MEITPESYEALTAQLFETLGKDHGVEILDYGSSSKIGQRQIDVQFQQSNGMQMLKTAVECKYRDDKIGPDVVEAFAIKHRRLGFDKGIIVSKNGFTPEAIKAARDPHVNIALAEMRQPTDTDWEGRIKEANFHVTVRGAITDSISFTATSSDLPEHAIHSAAGTLGDSVLILEPDRHYTLRDILGADEHAQQEEILIEFPDETRLEVEGFSGSAQITRLHITQQISEVAEEWRFDLMKDVLMLVKDIFENREWVWYNDQRIVEVKLHQETTE